jgi:hypothetical protein
MMIGAAIRSVVDRHLIDPCSRAMIATLRRLVAYGDLVLAIVTGMLALAYLSYLLFITHSGFWDFHSYVAAMKAMEAGASPYDVSFINSNFGTGLVRFVYPPLVAEVFYKLSGLVLTPAGLSTLLITTIFCTLTIPYLLADCPKRWYSPRFLYLYGFYFVLFGFGGIRLVASGNIQPIICATIVASIFAAVRTHDYRLFWFALAFCSFIKIYFIAFMLVPVILDKKYLASIVFIFLFGMLYATNYIFSPELFSQFVVVMGIESKDTLQSIGFSFYSLAVAVLQTVVSSNFRVQVIALSMHFFFVLFIFILAYVIAAKHTRPKHFDLFSVWLFMSAYLVSPRLLEYDMAIIVVPFVLLARMLILNGGIGLAVAAAASICSFFLIRTPFVPWIGTFALFGVWLGAAVHWLWPNVKLGEVRGTTMIEEV